MRLRKIIVILSVLNSSLIIGQWNVQTGYDFGFFTTDYYGGDILSKEDDSHHLHRINGRLEHQFKNNILVALNSGIDVHNIRHTLQVIEDAFFGGSAVEQQSTSIHHSTFQAYRMGFSIGYSFNLTKASSIFFEVNYTQFFFNRISNKQSHFVTNYYLNSDVENKNPDYSIEEYKSMIDLDKIGYKNKFKKENRHIIFSIGYRHQIGSFFVSPSIGFSPRNNSPIGTAFVIPKPQNLFLFGVNLGYTFPSKTK